MGDMSNTIMVLSFILFAILIGWGSAKNEKAKHTIQDKRED